MVLAVALVAEVMQLEAEAVEPGGSSSSYDPARIADHDGTAALRFDDVTWQSDDVTLQLHAFVDECRNVVVVLAKQASFDATGLLLVLNRNLTSSLASAVHAFDQSHLRTASWSGYDRSGRSSRQVFVFDVC